ncbi:MAG TPA: helix-turn-helix transcriptional regulator [Galbitalea sp.]|jgi:transcriptional regulator with XRE-family HTH domain|nr:helix-turn-helix transcriptional regulator [Galbitalea sp.]
MNEFSDVLPVVQRRTNTFEDQLPSAISKQGAKYLLLGAAISTSIVLGSTGTGMWNAPSTTSISVTSVLSQPSKIALSTVQLLRRLRDSTGLTWEQLAQAMGVSRRSIHNWMIGEKLSAHNVEILARLDRLVDDLRGRNVEETRIALVHPDENGVSPLDAFRQRVANSGLIVTPRAGRPSDLLNSR